MTFAPNGIFARALVAHLAANGVTRFVLCPGSRSGPLAHVLAEAASSDPPLKAPPIDLSVRIDERSAGFFALGLAMATGDPVAVVTTSGSAVGNLLPAVMEACHSGHRLILLTADRPFDMRGTGPNQTTDQRGIFGGFVQWSRDVFPPTPGRALVSEAEAIAVEAIARASGAVPAPHPASDSQGPVHLNLQFRPPLGRDHSPWPSVQPAVLSFPEETSPPPLPTLERGIVVAGHGAGSAPALVASIRGWPLFAEPTSDARRGSACVLGYAEALIGDRAQPLIEQTEFVLVVGRPTLSPGVTRLIAEAPRLWVARHGGRWRQVPAHAEVVLRDVPFEWVQGRPEEAGPGSWLESWKALGREPAVDGWNSRAIAHEVVRSVGAGAILVVGSSGPIRALDSVLPPLRESERPRILGNRGLSGIDGTVSTAMGAASAGLGPVTAILGDLTFLHDGGGLWVEPDGRQPDLRIVVVNDGGGTLFTELEHGAAPAPILRRVFTVPHGVDIGSLCRAYRANHVAVRSRVELAAVLSKPGKGLQVVEARLAPEGDESEKSVDDDGESGTIEG